MNKINKDNFLDFMQFLKQKKLRENLKKENLPIQQQYNVISRLTVSKGLRKPKMAMYDYALHFIGGAQKYLLTIAQALKNDFDITLICHREINLKTLENWYKIDLSGCNIEIIPLAFYEKDNKYIDPSLAHNEEENPFDLVSIKSGEFDFFINGSMNEMVYPLSNVSVFICHFPERKPNKFFYVREYDYILNNSDYGAFWTKKIWSVNPHLRLYPPVDVNEAKQEEKKENIILSVARFELGGSKKQKEMLKNFLTLNKNIDSFADNWTLYLIGGSSGTKDYTNKLKKILKDDGSKNVHIIPDAKYEELLSLYGKAKIFWHLCGLNEEDPSRIEHFGMTTVEAMAKGAVPIVFNGGGQKEIVENGISGFRVNTKRELSKKTLELIKDENLWKELSKNAKQRSQIFSKENFIKETQKFFSSLLEEYKVNE